MWALLSIAPLGAPLLSPRVTHPKPGRPPLGPGPRFPVREVGNAYAPRLAGVAYLLPTEDWSTCTWGIVTEPGPTLGAPDPAPSVSGGCVRDPKKVRRCTGVGARGL